MGFAGGLILAVGSATWLVRRRQTLSPRLWWVCWLVPVVAVGLAILWAPHVLLLRKAFALLMMPVGLLWIALIAAWLRWRKEPQLKWGLGLLMIAYTLAGNGAIGSALMRNLEAPYQHLRPLQSEPGFDAVFVLGGGTRLTPSFEAQLGPSGDRVRLGAALYTAGLTRRLVTSGSGFYIRDVTQETTALWRLMGVPDTSIHKLPDARNTAQEIGLYADLIRRQGWRRVGLVTSARHMRRAQALARRHRLTMEPLPADFRAGPGGPDFLALIPDGHGFHTVGEACWEYLGILYGLLSALVHSPGDLASEAALQGVSAEL